MEKNPYGYTVPYAHECHDEPPRAFQLYLVEQVPANPPRVPLSAWDYAVEGGRMEVAKRYDSLGSDQDAGVLELDCLMCHLSGYDHLAHNEQIIRYGKFRNAAATGSTLAEMDGAADGPFNFDYLATGVSKDGSGQSNERPAKVRSDMLRRGDSWTSSPAQPAISRSSTSRPAPSTTPPAVRPPTSSAAASTASAGPNRCPWPLPGRSPPPASFREDGSPSPDWRRKIYPFNYVTAIYWNNIGVADANGDSFRSGEWNIDTAVVADPFFRRIVKQQFLSGVDAEGNPIATGLVTPAYDMVSEWAMSGRDGRVIFTRPGELGALQALIGAADPGFSPHCSTPSPIPCDTT